MAISLYLTNVYLELARKTTQRAKEALARKDADLFPLDCPSDYSFYPSWTGALSAHIRFLAGDLETAIEYILALRAQSESLEWELESTEKALREAQELLSVNNLPVPQVEQLERGISHEEL